MFDSRPTRTGSVVFRRSLRLAPRRGNRSGRANFEAQAMESSRRFLITRSANSVAVSAVVGGPVVGGESSFRKAPARSFRNFKLSERH